MRFRTPLDSNSIRHQIHIAGVEINDSRNDGFTQFEIKKELYLIKQLVDKVLERSPRFIGEEDFLDEIEQREIINILKK